MNAILLYAVLCWLASQLPWKSSAQNATSYRNAVIAVLLLYALAWFVLGYPPLHPRIG